MASPARHRDKVGKTSSDLVRWQHEKLRRSLRHNQRLELAIEALIAQDLARKLSKSTPILSERKIM